MKMPILTLVIIFVVILTIAIRSSNKKEMAKDKSFWDKEHDANFTRKKNIDDLDYITIPDEILEIVNNSFFPEPITDTSDVNITRQELDAAKENINKLSSAKIVALNGITNTELKLKYGAPNIDILSEYDQNFSDLIISVTIIVKALLLENNIDKAMQLLYWAVTIGADTSFIFITLAELYAQSDNHAQIHYLIKQAENIESFRKDSIIRELNKILDSDRN